MPTDKRLWMTFPIDFDEHEKVVPLSDAAFRAFVEMNGYSRRQDLDGYIQGPVAVKRWGLPVMDELVASHPERPLVLFSDGVYVIRDYAEHQETIAQREERKRINQENGRKGGRPRKNPTETHSVTDSVSGSLFGSGAESGTEQKAESRVQRTTTKTSKSQSLPIGGRLSTDAIPISAMTKRLAGQQGVTNLRAVVDAVAAHCQVRITADQAYQLSVHILGKRQTPPDAPQRYVLGAIVNSPAEIQQHIYESMEIAS